MIFEGKLYTELNAKDVRYPVFIISKSDFMHVCEADMLNVAILRNFEKERSINYVYMLTEDGNCYYVHRKYELIYEDITDNDPTEHYQDWRVDFMRGNDVMYSLTGTLRR
jgi:hypothetical protein